MLALASPANAAVTIDCTDGASPAEISGDGPFEFAQGSTRCRGYNVRTSIDASDVTIEEYRGAVSGWVVQDNNVVLNNNGSSGENTNGGVRITVAPGASGTVYVDFYLNQYNDPTPRVTYTVTVGSGGDSGGGDSGGGDSGSSGSSAGSGSSSTAPTVLLQALDLFGDDALPADENELVGWEKAVPVNTWQALPQSQDVVGIGPNEGKVFLGMATTPNFPVDIAQRQVDNGWGAYEMHGDDGKVESVFIPAGGSMFVWTQPRLYAVWGTA